MQRRQFFLGAAAALLLPRQALALPEKTNGRVVGREFHWHHIGRDPFGAQDLSTALHLMGVPNKYCGEIMNRIQIRPGEYRVPDATDVIREGYAFDAMVSGGVEAGSVPWVATNVRPFPNGWESWQRQLDVWNFHWSEDRTYYTILRPHGCSNWSIIVVQGSALRCRCSGNDVCAR